MNLAIPSPVSSRNLVTNLASIAFHGLNVKILTVFFSEKYFLLSYILFELGKKFLELLFLLIPRYIGTLEVTSMHYCLIIILDFSLLLFVLGIMLLLLRGRRMHVSCYELATLSFVMFHPQKEAKYMSFGTRKNPAPNLLQNFTGG